MRFRLWLKNFGRRNSRSAIALLIGGLLVASCAGSSFSGENDDGNGGDGGSGPPTGGTSGSGTSGASGTVGTGGASGSAGTGGTSSGGTAGNAPSAGAAGAAAGGTGGGGAGAGDGGAGGTPGGGDCTALGGVEFEDHCYVDATVGSATQPEAVAACRELSSQARRPGHLLVLDSSAEQAFILEEFLVAHTDESDAWLALTCHELAHPDINDCYCAGCSAEALVEKQRAWAWLDGSSATFGWVNSNPNDGTRCAALGFNPATTIWGWVDRACDKNTYAPTGRPPHDYRTICELE